MANAGSLPALTAVQLGVVAVATAAFLAAFVIDLPGLRKEAGGSDGVVARRKDGAAIGVGTGLAVLLLVWRGVDAGSSTLVLQDFFDAFLLLGLMLAGLVGYFRVRGTMQNLSVFLLPMVSVVLAVGGVLGYGSPRNFHVTSGWSVVHLVTVLMGSACFAAGCVGGVVYLLADRQLRRKGLTAEHRWIGLPPLASMERFLQRCALLGFPLLTIAIIAGVFGAIEHPEAFGSVGQVSPKLVLAGVVWVIYALVLHVRFAPVFRGRRAAWLSIVGFVLLLGVYVAVIGMPR